MRPGLPPLAGRIPGGRDSASLLRPDRLRADGAVDRPQAHQAAVGSPATLLDGLGHPGRTGAETAAGKKSQIKPSGRIAPRIPPGRSFALVCLSIRQGPSPTPILTTKRLRQPSKNA